MALMQPTMQFVPPKSLEQQDIQALHRARQRFVNHRTETVCQIRGLLLDRGITIGAAVSRVRRAVPLILEDAENGLSHRMRRTIAELYDLFNDLGRRISKRPARLATTHIFQRLIPIRCVFHLSASAPPPCQITIFPGGWVFVFISHISTQLCELYHIFF